MNNPAPGLRLTNVSQTLGSHAVFHQLSLSLKGQCWHCFLGRSGVGKTTLLRLLAGLDIPDTGKITDDSDKSLTEQVSYMSQDDGLLPWLSVVDNVQLGPRLRRKATSATRANAMDLLSSVDLLEWADASPEQLSGGMRQRVALARTLLEDRSIVLMDEPFSRLDAITRDELQRLASQLLHDRTVVLVTHDPHEALRLGHTIHVLQRKDAANAIGQSHTHIVELDDAPRSQTSGPLDMIDMGATYLSAASEPDAKPMLSPDVPAQLAMKNLWSLLKASGAGNS